MKKVELNDFKDYKSESSLTYSPDGKKLAFIVTTMDKEENKYLNDLYLYENDNLKRFTSDGKVGSFFFEDNNHIIFEATRDEKDEKRQKDGDVFTVYYRLPLDGGEAQKAFELKIPGGKFEKLEDGSFLIASFLNSKYPDMYKLEGEEREKKLKEIKDEEDYEVYTESPFVFNGEGVIDSLRGCLYHYDPKNKKLDLLTDPNFTIDSYVVMGDMVYLSGLFREKLSREETAIYSLNIKTKELKEIMSKREGYLSFEGKTLSGKIYVSAVFPNNTKYALASNSWFYLFDPKTNELELINKGDESMYPVLTDVEYGGCRLTKVEDGFYYFLSTDKYYTHLKRLDARGKISNIIDKEGAILDFDVKKGHVAIMGLFDMKPEEVYVKNSDDSIKQISSFNEEYLVDRYIAKPEYINTIFNDEDIDGWVLYPFDYDSSKTYPAILDIHGGPKCAYGPVYFHEMQLWASMGFFVMFCNPHGSDGKGAKFAFLNEKWGTIDYDHIMAFVDNVLDHYPQIDKTKLCCTGGSYGGYMSNWILTHTDRFACIATQRSISNWISMYGISDCNPCLAWECTTHNPYSKEGIEDLWRVSPLKYVLNAKTPTLFIHSEEDYRCPLPEGLQLYTALVYLGVETRFVEFHGENHELSRGGKPNHRERRLKEITNWFESHTK